MVRDTSTGTPHAPPRSEVVSPVMPSISDVSQSEILSGSVLQDTAYRPTQLSRGVLSMGRIGGIYRIQTPKSSSGGWGAVWLIWLCPVRLVMLLWVFLTRWNVVVVVVLPLQRFLRFPMAKSARAQRYSVQATQLSRRGLSLAEPIMAHPRHFEWFSMVFGLKMRFITTRICWQSPILRRKCILHNGRLWSDLLSSSYRFGWQNVSKTVKIRV